MRIEIARILYDAHHAEKQDELVYLEYKSKVSKAALTPKEYDDAIKELCRILDI